MIKKHNKMYLIDLIILNPKKTVKATEITRHKKIEKILKRIKFNNQTNVS